MNVFVAIAMLCQVSGAGLVDVSKDQVTCQHFFVGCMGEKLYTEGKEQSERLKTCVNARKN